MLQMEAESMESAIQAAFPVLVSSGAEISMPVVDGLSK